MKNKKKQDTILAVVCAVIGIALLLLIPQEVRVVSTGVRGAVTARTFPYMAGGLMVLSSLGLLLNTLLCKAPEAQTQEENTVSPEEAAAKKKGLIRTGLSFVLMILYVIVMQWIGFILASIIFGMIFLYLTGIRKWWQYAIFAVLMFPLFALFKYVLYVPLPTLFL